MKSTRSHSIFLKWHHSITYLILLGSVFAVYANLYGNLFLFDDAALITDNELLRNWQSFGQLLTASTTEGAHVAGGFFRPVQNILYFIIYQITGPSVIAFHLLNISLHGLNACLVYALGRKLSFNAWASFFAALLWAVHPLNTEAIAYISGSADPLYVAFSLLALLLVLPDFKRSKIWLSLPLFLLALLSKETAVIYPMLVVSLIYFKAKKKLSFKTYFVTWPLWLITALYLYFRLTAVDLNGPMSYSHIFADRGQHLRDYSEHFSLRFYTFLATLPAYLTLIIWPEGLHMERIFPIFSKIWIPAALEGLAILFSMTAQIVMGQGKRALPLSFGFLWFLIAQFPNTGLLVATNSLFLEHWMYMPMIGLFLGSSETISQLLKIKKGKELRFCLATLSLIVSIIFGILTYEQNLVWHDPVTFYKNILKYGEASSRTHSNLALTYMKEGKVHEAIDEFHKAIAITDSYAEARNNLAVAILMLPDYQDHTGEAIANLNRALEIDPKFYKSYEVLGLIYDHQGDHKKALEYFNKGAEIRQSSLPIK